MFERFTESARRVLFYSRHEASATGSLQIDSEHLLLGVLREPGPVARRILADAQLSLERLREEIAARIPFVEKTATSHEIPFSQPAQLLLNYAAQEADDLRHRHIGPEHLLLALLRVPESGGGAVLIGHGLQLQATRDAVRALFAESEGAPTAQADTDGVAAHIERVQGLVGRLRMSLTTLPEGHEAGDLLHLIHIELRSLKSRFS